LVALNLRTEAAWLLLPNLHCSVIRLEAYFLWLMRLKGNDLDALPLRDLPRRTLCTWVLSEHLETRVHYDCRCLASRVLVNLAALSGNSNSSVEHWIAAIH
jgi:hypothetical protein